MGKTYFESKKGSLVPCDISQVDPEIINVIGVELRKNKKIRDFLIPLYAKSKLGQLFYFESFFDMDCLVLHSGDNIRYYLENNHSDDAKIYGHFLKFLQYFLAGDQVNCKKEYELFQSFELPDTIKPAHAGYYYGAQIIYQSVFKDKLDKNLVKRISQKSDIFFERGTQSETSIPIFEFTIVFSLNYGNKFTEILELVNLIFDKYELSDLSSSWHYQLFLSMYARALLNTGEVQKGLKLFKQVELKTVPVKYSYYIKLRYYLIQAEFLIFEKKINKAKQVIEEIKTISQMLRHKYFYDKALMIENEILP